MLGLMMSLASLGIDIAHLDIVWLGVTSRVKHLLIPMKRLKRRPSACRAVNAGTYF